MDKLRPIRVLLVGIGGYGTTYVREILENPDELIELVGVVDPFPERCMWLEALKLREVPIYCNMEEFYCKQSADLAVISTPIFLHTQHMLTALKYGSNVLCEKPLCSDEADIDVLYDAQKKAGKFIYIGYQWPYSDAIAELKKDILSGKFGKLIEMKTLILRPRDRDYFERGIGWAGKINTQDGKIVYDSIANNSAAHFLFNMFYLMGEDGSAAAASDISAELLRANKIENFDICKIHFKMPNGAEASFIAAHPVNKALEPIFEYRFDKGNIYYSSKPLDDSIKLLPDLYEEYGQIAAIMCDGSKVVYGDPMVNSCKKLHMAVKAVAEGRRDDGPCGLKATSEHTRLINHIQKNYNIFNVKTSLLRKQERLLYVEGLYEYAISSYMNTSKSILNFAD